MVSLGFLATCAAVIVAPGPMFTLLVNRSLRYGRRLGFVTIMGNTTGLAIWATASAFGLTELIRTSEFAFSVLKIVGAAYLCGLGARAVLRSRRPPEGAPGSPVAKSSVSAAFRAGLLTNLSNPKAAVLYLALLPQFIPPHANAAGATAVLAAVQMAMSATWYSFVVLALGQFRKLLSRPTVKRRIEQATGLVLVGLGARMLTLAKA
jgi:threonine/homoserine/homoserine lactone efflux protein